MRAGFHDVSATLLNPPGGMLVNLNDPLALFKHMFPTAYIRDHLIPGTNANGRAHHANWKDLDEHELFLYIGMWMVMSFSHFSDRRTFWSTERVSMFTPSARFHHVMSRERFEAITSSLVLGDEPAGVKVDPFLQVRPLVTAWNANMRHAFSSSWLVCLDESMCKHTNTHIPGAQYKPNKFTTRGLEFHTIGDKETDIIFFEELVEGKDRPAHLPMKKYNDRGLTRGLLLRTTEEAGILSQGKVVILDAAFCQLEAVMELRRHDTFPISCIKRKRYYPANVPGADMDKEAEKLEVGKSVAKKGKFTFPGDSTVLPFHIVATRDSKYVFKLLCTAGATNVPEGPLVKRKGKVTFQHHQSANWYYRGRASVDHNNNKRQHDRPLEEVWVTHDWQHRVLAHLVNTSEVNACYAFGHFFNTRLPLMEFRAKLAHALLDLPTGEPKEHLDPHPILSHALTPFPHHSKWMAEEDLTGEDCATGHWEGTLKTKYITRVCGCGKQSRFYCTCDPSTAICRECFNAHITHELTKEK